MNSTNKRRRYRILLAGYLLIWGMYFGGRTFEALTKEIASGEVVQVVWGKFIVESARSHMGGHFDGYYPCPQVRFRYKSSPVDTGAWYMVKREAYSFREHIQGEKISVIFPSHHPECAVLYTPGEFWFVPPYMIMLLVISAFWTVGFIVVVFKPWRVMYMEQMN